MKAFSVDLRQRILDADDAGEGSRQQQAERFSVSFGLVKKLLAQRQAKLRYLPAYSPDLNPIEKMWRKVKALLRGAKARTEETLLEQIGKALTQVTSQDAQGGFQSCGYVI